MFFSCDLGDGAGGDGAGGDRAGGDGGRKQQELSRLSHDSNDRCKFGVYHTISNIY